MFMLFNYEVFRYNFHALTLLSKNMKLLTKPYLFFYILFLLISNSLISQKNIHYAPWRHPSFLAYMDHSPGFRAWKNGKDRVIKIIVGDSANNTFYYFTKFGTLSDSVHTDKDLFNKVRIGIYNPTKPLQLKIDYAISIYASSIEWLRMKGIEFKENKETDSVHYNDSFKAKAKIGLGIPEVVSAGSSLEKLMLIEKFLSEELFANKILNTELTYTSFSHPKGFKAGTVSNITKGADTILHFYNRDNNSGIPVISLNEKLSKLFVEDYKGDTIDVVAIKPESVKVMTAWKTNAFVLYCGWIEWNLEQSRRLITRADKEIRSLNKQGLALNTSLTKGLTSYWIEVANEAQAIEKNMLGKVATLLNPLDQYWEDELWNIRNYETYDPVNGFSSFSVIYDSPREYELTDHRGNVIAVISDQKKGVDKDGDGVVDYYEPIVLSATDFYSFGSPQPGRTFKTEDYRYGYNGKEKDAEVKGDGNEYDYGFRIYDPRLGRFLSVDPLTKDYPFYTPYQFAGNKPIWATDMDGKEEVFYYDKLTGWTASKFLHGPFTGDALNELGYYTAQQVHKIKEQARKDQEAADRRTAREEAIEALNTIQLWNNPFGIAHELNPFRSAFDVYDAASNGEYKIAAAFAVGAFVDLGPLLKVTGKEFTALGRSLAQRYSIDATWKMPPFFRGILIEAKLANEYIAKGCEWMAESASKYFGTFDFYDKAKNVAISLKTVNAEKNFSFENIMDNIRQLKKLKANGSVAVNGLEYKVSDVELHIAVPKGYDQTKLIRIVNEANNNGVKTFIFEHK
jgi:RHS repeat-associated protein